MQTPKENRKKVHKKNLSCTPFLRPGKIHFKGTNAEKYFRSVDWHVLWEEFLTSRQKDGRLTYLTAYAFARKKAHNDWQLRILYRAIGPKPVDFRQMMRQDKYRGNQVPWLGDWQQLRAKAYFYDNASVDKMKEVITERLDGLEAGRGAATLVLDLIEKWTSYDVRIDEVFESSPVVAGLGVDAQQRRARFFYGLKERNLKALLGLIDKYLACHGIATDGLNDLGQLVMAVSQSSAKSALAAAATGAALAGSQPSPALEMLNKAIIEKSRIFNMPLPVAVNGDSEKREEEDEEAS